MKIRTNYFLALLVLSSAIAMATTDVTKIGFVNFDKAFAEEHEAQKFTKELEQEEQGILEAEQKASMEIEKKLAEFQKKMNVLSEKAKMDQQAALSKEYNDVREKMGQRRMEVSKKRQDIVSTLENRNRFVLETVARKEGLSLVLNGAAVVYLSDELKKNDITSKLVEAYNLAYTVKKDDTKKKAEKTKSK